MSISSKWCLDTNRIKTFGKQLFYVDRKGYKRWYLNGKYHRLNGPAVEFPDGYKCWYLNGKPHRVNGPAIENVNGTKCWFLNDKRHRVGAAAIEFANGSKEWWLNGKEYYESDYWKELKK